MAGADYFLRAVELYDRKTARDAEMAYRETRDARADEVNDRNFANTVQQQEQQQSNADRNFAITEENQAFTRSQRDAANRVVEAIRNGPGTNDVHMENFNSEVVDLMNPEVPGTTLVPAENGDYDVMETFEDGSLAPHTTDDGRQVKVPAMLANTAFSIANNQGQEDTVGFIANNGGLTLNQETGMMEFPGAPDIGNDSTANLQPNQPAPSLDAIPVESEIGMTRGDTAFQQARANALAGDDQPSEGDDIVAARNAALNPEAEAPVAEAPVAEAPVAEAPVAEPKTSIAKADATDAETLASSAQNYTPSATTHTRTEQTIQNGGRGSFTESQRRNVAADGIASGLMTPQQGMNFIETGDMSKSIHDLEAQGITTQIQQNKLLKSELELAKLAQDMNAPSVSAEDKQKNRVNMHKTLKTMAGDLLTTRDKKGKTVKEPAMAEKAANGFIAAGERAGWDMNTVLGTTNGIEAFQNYTNAYKYFDGKPGATDVAFRASSKGMVPSNQNVADLTNEVYQKIQNAGVGDAVALQDQILGMTAGKSAEDQERILKNALVSLPSGNSN